MWRRPARLVLVLVGWVLVGLVLVCSPELLARSVRQEPTTAPTLTGKQQRELLRWSHRRIQRDLRRLAKLSEELQEQARKHKSELLTPEQRAAIAELQESVGALRDEFDKSDPFILALDMVARADSIQARAKNLREHFDAMDKGRRQFSKLQALVREIEERAEGIAKRLRNP